MSGRYVLEASTEGHQTYPESHELTQVIYWVILYNKINQYYIVQAAIADTIWYASPEDDGLETLTV